MQKNILILVRRIVFVACVCVLGLFTAKVVRYKSSYLSMMKTFLGEPPDTYDVIAAGSSHMYCTLTPIELYRNFNITAYCLATQRQPIEVSYTYLKKAIALQNPKVIILELYMFARDEDTNAIDEGVAHDSFDPLPLDWDKVDLLFNANFKGSIEDYFFPFIKYHSRWKELKEKDFNSSLERNINKGYRLLVKKTKFKMSPTSFQDAKSIPLSDRAQHWLETIVCLAKSSDTELILLLAPYTIPADMKQAGRIKHIDGFAKENGLAFLNMMERFNEIGFDSENDFYDNGHLNVFGAEKATKYIGDYLTSHCRIEPARLDAEQKAMWAKDTAQYDVKRKKAISDSLAQTKNAPVGTGPAKR